MTVALGLGSLLILAVVVFSLYCSRSFVAMKNYAELGEQSALSVDKFTQQVRQVKKLTDYVVQDGVITSLTFQDYDDKLLTFRYDSGKAELLRAKDGVTNVFLSGCTSLQFSIYQRTPQPFTFDAVTTSVATNCKLVEVTWTCSRNILKGDKASSDIVQSAKVAIRSN